MQKLVLQDRDLNWRQTELSSLHECIQMYPLGYSSEEKCYEIDQLFQYCAILVQFMIICSYFVINVNKSKYIIKCALKIIYQ